MARQAPSQGPIPDLRSMEELLQAPTDGVGDAIVIGLLNLVNRWRNSSMEELKISLLNLVTTIAFHGFENDDSHSHIRRFTKITQTVKLNNVTADVVKLLLFPFTLEGAARTWLEKEPPNSITTWNDLVSKFVNRFFPPSKTTNLRNEITRFQQRFGKTFAEACDRFKDLLNKCPHHGFSPFHQIDTFYNNLNQSKQDSLNSAANGNFLTNNTQEALTIIENKFKVQTSRNKPQVASASGILTQDAHINSLTKKVESLLSLHQPVNSVQNGYEICGGPHAYYECQAIGGCTQEDVYATTGTRIRARPRTRIDITKGYNQNQAQLNVPSFEEMMNLHMRTTEARMQQIHDYNNQQMQILKNQNTNMTNKMDQMQKVLMERPQGVLPSNIIPNTWEDLKAITIQSGVTLAGPSVPPPPLSSSKQVKPELKTTTDQILTDSTIRVPPLVVQSSPASTSSELPHAPVTSLVISEPNPHQPPIPYPSRLNKEKLQDKADIQIHSFLQMFKKIYFNISFAEALTHMPKLAKMVKDLLTNKEKLLELANTPLNENC
ncbi:reverse transcriptase domain-containing protein [Tanacetum coccineum]|uniref:Reverse transcriptase domain-containing protein n=1 Tax=Tanacetum coccineum TaxID=301880 RepID=A0ABQ5GGP3_9ASTR